MRTTLFVLCMLCATAMLGQSVSTASALSSQTQQIQIPSHPEHASAQALGQVQDLRERSSFAYGQGERPLWEFAPRSEPVPLGTVARDLRKEHATAKKAQTVWEN
jgi:hypothetical protein